MSDIKQLFQEMSNLTSPECASSCRLPHSCCDEMYCRMTKEYAEERGVTLEPTGHPTLLFMGPQGCTVEPWLRPLCTLHTCSINGLGFKQGDEAWTEKYFQLREKIEEAMWEKQ